MRPAAAVLLAAIVFPSAASARIPPARRAMNQAAYQLERTPTGAALDALRGRHGLQLAWRFVADPPAPGDEAAPLYRLEYPSGVVAFNLRLHSHLISAWPEYRSWVLAQGLTLYQAHVVFAANGVDRLPETAFAETDRIAFLKSIRHWDELGAPADKDLAADARFPADRNLALRYDASVSRFYALWRDGIDGFLGEVDRRRRASGAAAQTLDEYLADPARAPAELAAGRALKAEWARELAEARDYWLRRQGQGFAPLSPAAPAEAAERPSLGLGKALGGSAAFGQLAGLAD